MRTRSKAKSRRPRGPNSDATVVRLAVVAASLGLFSSVIDLIRTILD